jgi:hypothetical protein
LSELSDAMGAWDSGGDEWEAFEPPGDVYERPVQDTPQMSLDAIRVIEADAVASRRLPEPPPAPTQPPPRSASRPFSEAHDARTPEEQPIVYEYTEKRWARHSVGSGMAVLLFSSLLCVSAGYLLQFDPVYGPGSVEAPARPSLAEPAVATPTAERAPERDEPMVEEPTPRPGDLGREAASQVASVFAQRAMEISEVVVSSRPDRATASQIGEQLSVRAVSIAETTADKARSRRARRLRRRRARAAKANDSRSEFKPLDIW